MKSGNIVGQISQTTLGQPEKDSLLYSLFQFSKEIIICLSTDFLILELNQAAETLFRGEKADILGSNFLDQCDKINLRFPLSISPKEVLPGQRITGIETTLLDGHKFITWTVIHSAADNQAINMFIFIGQDNTPLRRVEITLKKAQEYSEGTNEELAKFNHLVTGQDIIAKKSLIDYAKDIYEYLENIIANMPVSVYWLNRQGEYLGCSNSFATLFKLKSRNEIVGKTYKDLYDQKSGDFYKAVDAEVMNTGIAKILEEPLYQADGSVSTWLSSKVPLRNSSEQVIGMLGTSIDITARKNAEKALKEAKEAAETANKAKTEFLENMRHDIRTPLSGIIGFSDLLIGEKDPHKIEEYCQGLADASRELLSFLNEILESINVASGEIPILKKKFNLKRILEKVISLNKPKAMEKRLNLNLSFDENIPPYLIGDSVRIYRIVLELVVNALKFTKQGSVSVSAELSKKEENEAIVKIIVEDTGPGVPVERQQELFVRFKRLTASYQGIYKGIGLGLSIIKQFMDDLQGEIYVISHPEKTTKFICIIPLKTALLDESLGAQEMELQAAETLSQEKIAIGKNLKVRKKPKIKVLVIEDQDIAAMVVKNILEKLGCEVDISIDGKSAINLVKRESYNLIIVDIGLPNMDGYETTEQIRKLEAQIGHTAFIIGLTAHVNTEKSQKGLDVGMNMVLEKPLMQTDAIRLLQTFVPGFEPDSYKDVDVQTKNSLNIHKSKAASLKKFEITKNISQEKSSNHTRELLKMFVSSFPQEEARIEEARKRQDWRIIEGVANKLRGSCDYCGAFKLKEATSQLMDYLAKGGGNLNDEYLNQVRKEMKDLEEYCNGF